MGTGLDRNSGATGGCLESKSISSAKLAGSGRNTQPLFCAPLCGHRRAVAWQAIRPILHNCLHGADYWRTVLDVACGIDIYGHNGVSVGDIDDDGFDDLYVCQPAGLPNRLYRNRGDGTFEDITEASGVGVLENTACALFADIDNDGRQDLIVVRTSGPLLFLNRAAASFATSPMHFKFATPPQGTFTGAAIADYDRDGWLDIYFCLYLYYQGTDQYKYPSPYYDAENGPPNFLMRNQRDGTFRDVTAETGLDKNNTRYSFCCGWNDYNRDGWPDLYVVNDFGRKNLYRNNGDGTFTDVAAAGRSGRRRRGHERLLARLRQRRRGRPLCRQHVDRCRQAHFDSGNLSERCARSRPARSIGNMPWEIRCFVTTATALFRIRGASAGVEMGRWAWSSDAWDFDHDGFPDLYVTNGMVSGPSRDDLNSFFWRQVVANSPAEAKPAHDYEQGWNAINELIRSDGTWSGYERNVFYANNRDGTFSDVSGAVGLDFLEDGRAFALADFDHDGRLEVFLKNRNGPQLRALEERDAKILPPSISFRLQGKQEQSRRYRRRDHRRNRFGAADSHVCRPDRDFSPNTAKMCSSDWERRKARCGRRSAGPAGWCRNYAIFRSTTGSGWRKDPSHHALKPSRHYASAPRKAPRSSHDCNRSRRRTCPQRLKPGCWRRLPRLIFLFPIWRGEPATLAAFHGKSVAA